MVLLKTIFEGLPLTDAVDISRKRTFPPKQKVFLDGVLGRGPAGQSRRAAALSSEEKARVAGSQAETELAEDPQAGRRPWMPFPGRTCVIEASGPRGSGLELREPNFP